MYIYIYIIIIGKIGISGKIIFASYMISNMIPMKYIKKKS